MRCGEFCFALVFFADSLGLTLTVCVNVYFCTQCTLPILIYVLLPPPACLTLPHVAYILLVARAAGLIRFVAVYLTVINICLRIMTFSHQHSIFCDGNVFLFSFTLLVCCLSPLIPLRMGTRGKIGPARDYDKYSRNLIVERFSVNMLFLN